MNKEMIEGFLRYLQSYYGASSRGGSGSGYISTQQPNAPKIHLFQSVEAGFPEEAPPYEVAGEADYGQQVNQMFGQADPGRPLN